MYTSWFVYWLVQCVLQYLEQYYVGGDSIRKLPQDFPTYKWHHQIEFEKTISAGSPTGQWHFYVNSNPRPLKCIFWRYHWFPRYLAFCETDPSAPPSSYFKMSRCHLKRGSLFLAHDPKVSSFDFLPCLWSFFLSWCDMESFLISSGNTGFLGCSSLKEFVNFVRKSTSLHWLDCPTTWCIMQNIWDNNNRVDCCCGW